MNKTLYDLLRIPLDQVQTKNEEHDSAKNRRAAQNKLNLITSPFTLIELLVILSMIVFLMSILVPVLNMAKDKASQIQCLNNQNDIGIATLIGTCDNNNKTLTYLRVGSSEFPWTRIMQKQELIDSKSDAFRCPSAIPEYYSNYYSYGCRFDWDVVPKNAYIRTPTSKHVDVNKIGDPSEYFHYMDTIVGAGSPSTAIRGYQMYTLKFFYDNKQMGGHFRHFEKANTWFFDGHAAPISIETYCELIEKQMNSGTRPIYANDKNLNYININ